MRSFCTHLGAPMRLQQLPSVYTDAPKQEPRAMQLPAPCRQRSSSSSGSRGSSCSCRATSDSSASSGPQQPSSSSSKASKSSWGSGWSGKRSGGAGSVFKKQSQQEKEPQADGPQQGAAVPEAEQLDPQLEASIRMNVERANQTLQDIIQEVLGELLVEEASAYVLGQEEADLKLNQAVRGAVVKRLEWLDSNFLAALNAFLSLPGVRSNPDLMALLGAVRTETLQLVSARLPPPVQVLNATLAHSRRGERDGVLRQALAGGAGDVPGTSLDALGAAAHQLIDDMEDQQVVADRVLLARLVLVREELRVLAERQASESFWHPDGSVTDTPAAAPPPATAAPASAVPSAAAAEGAGSSGSSQPFFAFHRSNLPARCAAFLKNLLSVSARDQRLGLLAKTFQEDWIAESPAAAASRGKPAEQPSFSQQRAATRDTNFGPGAQDQQQEAPDIVRPGRLLTTLHAMRQELEVQLVSSGVDSPAGAEALQLLRRLEDIRLEAMVALDRVQHSRPGSDSVASVSSSSVGGLDYELELAEHDASLTQAAAGAAAGN